jgi:hypothetical protein
MEDDFYNIRYSYLALAMVYNGWGCRYLAILHHKGSLIKRKKISPQGGKREKINCKRLRKTTVVLLN